MRPLLHPSHKIYAIIKERQTDRQTDRQERERERERERQRETERDRETAVSYTHLTLPTRR